MNDQTTPKLPQWVRTDPLDEKYANNVSFESSAWDLKMIFATLDQGMPNPQANPPQIKCHTTVRIPWKQAKLMAYAACLNILWHERSEGKIRVRSVPPNVDALMSSTGGADAELVKLDAMLRAVLFDEEAK